MPRCRKKGWGGAATAVDPPSIPRASAFLSSMSTHARYRRFEESAACSGLREGPQAICSTMMKHAAVILRLFEYGARWQHRFALPVRRQMHSYPEKVNDSLRSGASLRQMT